LSWSGRDQKKGQRVGCGWVSDTEFFINKTKLCDILQIKLNTLNVNLRQLGFERVQSREGGISYWKNSGFSISAAPETFERIRNSRCKPDSLMNLSVRAVYLPILEDLQLFMVNDREVKPFKKDAVELWCHLHGDWSI
jgi:hypothetical protein